MKDQFNIIQSIRKPMPKPSLRHGRNKYSRKAKHKKEIA